MICFYVPMLIRGKSVLITIFAFVLTAIRRILPG
jgi:hypothetical protein